MHEFALPSLGADMDDATLVQWYVTVGQSVKRGDLICLIESEKGAIDVETWVDGKVARLIGAPGQKVNVGETIAAFALPGEDWPSVLAAAAALAAGSTSKHAASTSASTSASSSAAAKVSGPQPAQAVSVSPPVGNASGPSTRPKVSPAARRLATELGIDLSQVRSSSADGVISMSDVQAARDQAALERAAPDQAATASPADQIKAPSSTPKTDRLSGMRAVIAAAMTRSKREIPHYYVGTEINVEQALAWLQVFNASRPVTERILFIALQLKAIALALREVPQLNGSMIDGGFRQADSINIGVVTSLRGGGVLVPALHQVDQMNLIELMAQLRGLLARARSGQLRSSDLADGTISLTNMGELGVDSVFGVVYPPQVAIIGLGRITQKPIVHNAAVVIARTMQATLSADHRVSDGLVGARFLNTVNRLLEQPEQL